VQDQYDAIIVGTGFASSFFLARYLERAAANARVLVLEKGPAPSHDWRRANRKAIERDSRRAVVNLTPEKMWRFNLSFGGGSNCWWAATPRLLPNDFRLKTTYGVGRDWPVTYDELEPHYTAAEELMSVAGPEKSPFPRSRPYPLPPHRLNDPDEILQAAYPDAYFAQPTARPTRSVPEKRPRCCANSVCTLCPIDSKFTIQNSLREPYEDPRVTLELEASVEAVRVEASVARGVSYRAEGVDKSARGDLVALGANAIFNPHILARSGLTHPLLGRRLFEQVSVDAMVDLDGVDGFQGSTVITGHGYMLYDGPHRRERPAVLLESINAPSLRDERGKWLQRMWLRCIFEDLPRKVNQVRSDPNRPEKPQIQFSRRSTYVDRGIAALPAELERVLAPLPVEKLTVSKKLSPTESHILGTALMGNDPEDSVVDRHLVHHQVRNLLVLGGSAFPVSSPANPTLTISALSLWAADRLLG
jgi:choline dehydrogenase-like flavoprotein